MIGLVVGSVLFAASAFAQTTAPVNYVQPLSPQALKEVQRHLKDIGSYTGTVDGIWGRDSQEALERFQRSRGIQVTSDLNQATLATLGIKPSDLLALGEAGSATTRAEAEIAGRSLTPDGIRTIQGRLRQLGLYQGETDGVWGESTQAALDRLQRDRGLQPTGKVNPNTLATMGLDSGVVMNQTR